MKKYLDLLNFVGVDCFVISVFFILGHQFLVFSNTLTANG